MKNSGMQPMENAEDRVLRYMDGSLSDAEQAELLHRASVSPEIRQLLTEYEQIQQLTQRARMSAIIPPALEERVLTTVTALAEEGSRPAGWFWSNNWFRVSSVVAVLGLSAAVFFGLRSSHEQPNRLTSNSNSTSSIVTNHDAASNGNSSAVQTPLNNRIAAQTSTENTIASTYPVASNSSTTAMHASDVHSVQRHTNTADHVSNDAVSSIHIDKRPLEHGWRSQNPRVLASHSNPSPASVEPARSTVSDIPAPSIGSDASPSPASASDVAGSVSAVDVRAVQHSHRALAEAALPLRPIELDFSQHRSNIEFGLQTSSGFSYPASGPSVHPFADFRASLGYFIGSQDIIGLRLTSGLFQTLPSVDRTATSNAIIIRRDLSETRQLAEEVFYGHRFILSEQSGLAFEISGGAGLIPQGNTVSLELGFKIPFGEHFMGTAGFSMMRIHSNAPTLQDLVNPDASGDTPVVYQGSDIRNTLNGRLQYGFSYRF